MSQRKRSLQFGLRKLLLWTAVVALYLGTLRTLNLELPLLIFCTCWLVAVAILRVAFGRKVARRVSVGAGVILLVWFVYLVDPALNRPSAYYPEQVLGCLILGALFGLAMFGLAEGIFRAVNWVDNLMRTKTDGETGRD